MELIQVMGPVIVVLGTIASAWFVYKSNQATHRLSGQDQLNSHLQEDNRIQRELTRQCREECRALKAEYVAKIAQLELMIRNLQHKAFEDEREIRDLKITLERLTHGH